MPLYSLAVGRFPLAPPGLWRAMTHTPTVRFCWDHSSLLVIRRFRLFILCLIAPLVINHLTPELITASIISLVGNYRVLLFLAWSAFALAAAFFICIIVSKPAREYMTPQLSSRVSIHPFSFHSLIVLAFRPVILPASSIPTHCVSSWGNIPFEYWRVSSPALSSSSTPSVPIM